MSAKTQRYLHDASQTQSAVTCQLILFANVIEVLRATAKKSAEVLHKTFFFT